MQQRMAVQEITIFNRAQADVWSVLVVQDDKPNAMCTHVNVYTSELGHFVWVTGI